MFAARDAAHKKFSATVLCAVSTAVLFIAGCTSNAPSAQPTPTASALTSASGAAPSSETSTTPSAPLPPALPGAIVFRLYTHSSETSGSLYVTDSNGAHQRRLTKGPLNEVDDAPDWSPDGSHLVFTRYISLGTENEVHQLVTVSADGSNPTPLTPGRPARGVVIPGFDDSGAFSPNGHSIAYGHSDGIVKNDQLENSNIFVMGSDGTHPTQVTNFPAYSGDTGGVAWSPGGKQLVFGRFNCSASPTCTSKQPGALALFTINVDGTGLTQLTPWSLGAGGTPDWSPKGDLIVFRAVQDEESGIGNFFSIHSDGTGLTQITHFKLTVISHKVAFSPDGRWITFAKAGADGVNDVFISKVDGTDLRQVTNTGQAASSPDWGSVR